MTLHQQHRNLAERVAKHEMGHYVIARALGFSTSDVSIEIIGHNGHRGTSGITLSEKIESIETLRAYLERRVIVLYAGAIAETLPGLGAPVKKVDTKKACDILNNSNNGSEQDFAKARELLNILRNTNNIGTDLADEEALNAEIGEINRKLFDRTVELVEEFAKTIIGLGCNLANRVEAPGKLAKLEAAYLEGLPAIQQIILMTP